MNAHLPMFAILAATEAADLGSKTTIVIICNIIFFGLVILIAVVAKYFPAWEAKQIERQGELKREREQHARSERD